MKKLLIVVALILIGGGGIAAFSVLKKAPVAPQQSGGVQPQQPPIITTVYECDAKKNVRVAFFDKKELKIIAPGSKPEPTGWVEIQFPDSSSTTLKQTISADGGRYANSDGSFVFWNKGRGALILENDTEKNYTHCIEVNKDTGGIAEVYHDGNIGFTMRYPSNFTVDESYEYTALGSEKTIDGVKFMIPQILATGTNLSSDSGISVEWYQNIEQCSADKFIETQNATATTLADGGVTYSVLASADAGVGNRYEETVFAIPDTNPCIAVRYFLHATALENYASGTILAFDKQSLLSQYDAIRRSLIVGQTFVTSHDESGVFEDYKNGTYRFNEKTVTLYDGLSEVSEIPDSETKVVTKYFGTETKGDVNGDGLDDVVFILTQNSGGSGTFYYATVALAGKGGYTGTNALLLGDRISPQTIEIKDAVMHVNFADRAPNEPLSAVPSVGVTKRFAVINGVLVEQQ
jgi:membrane-bound inhibitor of C-type lysozyme